MNNLEQVRGGTMRQSEAHFREARTFARDMVQSYLHGRLIQGEMERAGVLLNTLGGIGMSVVEFGTDAVDTARSWLAPRSDNR